MPYTPASQRPTDYGSTDTTGANYTSIPETRPNGPASLNTTLNLRVGDILFNATTGTKQVCTVAQPPGAAVWVDIGVGGAATLQTAYNGGNSVLLGPATEIAIDDSVAGVATNGMEIDCSTNNGVNLSLINGPGSVQLRVEDSGTAQGINVSADYISCDQTFTVQSTGALSDLALIAGQNAILTGTGGVAVTASTAAVSVTGQTASTLQTIGAGPAYVTTANGNVNISAAGGVNGLMTLSSTNTMTLDSDASILGIGDTGITLQTTNGTIAIDANGAGQDLLLTADDVGSLTAASVDITASATDVNITSTTSIDNNAGTSFNAVAGTSALMQSTTTATVDAGTDATVQAADDVFLRPGSDFYEERVQFNTDTGAGPSECARVRQTGDFITLDRARVYDPCVNVFNADHFALGAIAAGVPTQTPVVARGGQIELETHGGTGGDGGEVKNTIAWMTRSGDAYFRANISTDAVGAGDRQLIAGITEASINDNTATTSLSWFDFDPPTYGDANWRSVTADGAGNVTIKDTGVAATAGVAQTLEIQEGPEEVHFYIDNALVTSHVAGADDLPASGDVRLMAAGAIEVGNGASIKVRIGLLDGTCHLSAP